MKIVTAVVNNVDFIEIQYYTLKKYFKGEYEFIVFNDAKDFPDFTNDGDVTIKNKIEELCSRLNIKCINIPNDKHKLIIDASTRTSNSMNFILKYQMLNRDKYLLLDSDMFLVDYFDINKYSKYDCAIVLQSRDNFKVNYFWNGIYYFNMLKMKNIKALNWNCSPGCDTGWMTQWWLLSQIKNDEIPKTDDLRLSGKDFHTENIYFMKHLSSCSWDRKELPESLNNNTKLIEFLENDLRNENNKFFSEIYDDVFLHYRAGGNWRGEGLHLHKKITQDLKEALI
jgi:hypothetical protein